MNHTPPIFINQGKNTVGYFSIDVADNLVIFVHGFNGSAMGTWDNFPSLIKASNKFSKTDVIFYGYDSLKGQANNNALRFYNFLKTIIENPSKYGYRSYNTDNNFRYKRILIVAHSLGSIITRRALLNAKIENKYWLAYCKMVLFAPAHRGARIQKLVAECLPTVGKVLSGLGLIAIPALDDLKPDSLTIQNLITDSQQYLQQNQGAFTIAHTVVWANNEIVVYNERFCSDPVAELIDNKSHTAVCKPKTPNYLEPFNVVANAI